MSWRWLQRRRLTIALVAFFAGWYLLQLYVLSAFSSKAAIWWFYFTGDLSPGYFLAPISHDMANVGHLGANVALLLVFGCLAEPYLGRRRYVVFLLVVSLASIILSNVFSKVLGIQFWALAGASGGVVGLWAYISVSHRAIVFDVRRSDSSSHPSEVLFVAIGLLTPILVPGWEVYSAGAMNLSHAVGVLLGYVIALVEVPPQVSAVTDS